MSFSSCIVLIFGKLKRKSLFTKDSFFELRENFNDPWSKVDSFLILRKVKTTSKTQMYIYIQVHKGQSNYYLQISWWSFKEELFGASMRMHTHNFQSSIYISINCLVKEIGFYRKHNRLMYVQLHLTTEWSIWIGGIL